MLSRKCPENFIRKPSISIPEKVLQSLRIQLTTKFESGVWFLSQIVNERQDISDPEGSYIEVQALVTFRPEIFFDILYKYLIYLLNNEYILYAREYIGCQ